MSREHLSLTEAAVLLTASPPIAEMLVDSRPRFEWEEVGTCVE